MATYANDGVVNNFLNHTQEMQDAVAAMKLVKITWIIELTEKSLKPGSLNDNATSPKLFNQQLASEKLADQIDLINRIQFEIVDTAFGADRSGANFGIGSNGLMKIQINKDDFLGYYRFDTNPNTANGTSAAASYGGLNYLFARKWAHATQAGQQVDKDLWTLYSNRPDVLALPVNQRGAEYNGNDAEFVLNEQWANTYSDIVMDSLGLEGIPAPMHGFISGYIA